MTKITIKDVAERAGVSVTSVSRVLNNRGYISDNLRKKVTEAVSELNYTPNEIARSFSKNETKSIALIVPTVENPFFSELTFHIERELSKNGYHLFVGNSLNDPANEKEYLRMLQESRVDGIIVGSHNMDIDEYNKINGNIVSIERKINEEIPMIESNNYFGGEIATQELIQKGCKKIICVTGNQAVDTPANNRVIAYSNVMQENNLEEHIIEIPFTKSEEEKYNLIKKLFEENNEFDGIFAGDDIVAGYIMNVAKQREIKIPEELKVIGFDGTKIIQNLIPELTTVRQPIDKMAIKTVEVLLKIIQNEKVKNKYTFPVSLIKSKTTEYFG